MLKKSFFLLIILSPLFSYAQTTTKIIDEITNEIYYVLESNHSIKHGDYSKFTVNGAKFIKGHYTNGVKDSIWEVYNHKYELVEKFDFTKNELLHINLDDQEKNLKFKVINSTDSILDRVPIYLGGIYLFKPQLAKNIIYPQYAIENGAMGIVNVTFTLDKKAQISNYRVDNKLGFGLDQEAIRALKLVSNNWIPGMIKGQNVDVEITYPITFILAY